MAILISVLVGILSIALLLYPFIKRRFAHSARSSEIPQGQLGLDGRQAIYDDIKALQLDHELGSIDEKDYQQQLRAYRMDAAASLKDQHQIQVEIEQTLEEEILKAREPADDIPDTVPFSSLSQASPHEASTDDHFDTDKDADRPDPAEGEQDSDPLR